MFSIHIHDKDGEARRQTFDKFEITVGRVQGNDLQLPRGSVSKRHARFAYRDGRFVVTDLKSTNGTYVNGRRIAEPTRVSEGDSVHVGGYELRLSLPEPRIEDHPTAPPPRPRPDTGAFAPPSTIPPSALWSEEAPAREGHGLALGLVTKALATSFDLDELATSEPADSVLDRLFERVSELATTLLREGRISAEISPAVLCRDVHRELFELGPLGPLLDDPDVGEIRVVGHERVFVKSGSRITPVEPAFSSERALLRVLERLVESSGEPLGRAEAVVTRQLPRGVSLQAFLQPVSLSGPLLVLRKPPADDLDLDDLVQSGVLSSQNAAQLAEALDRGGNLLVVSPSSELPTLASALVRGEGAVLLHPPGRAWIAPDGAVALALAEGQEGAGVIRSALRLGASRLLAGFLGGEHKAGILDAIAEGARGVVLVTRASSIEAGLERCATSISASRPSLTTERARAWLQGSFDLMIELGCDERGRERLLRVVEARELSSKLG